MAWASVRHHPQVAAGPQRERQPLFPSRLFGRQRPGSWPRLPARLTRPAFPPGLFSSADEAHSSQPQPQQQHLPHAAAADESSTAGQQAYDPDAIFAPRPRPRPLVPPPPDSRAVRRRNFFVAVVVGGAGGLMYTGFRTLRHSASPANVVVGSFLGMISTALYTVILDPIERFSPIPIPFAASATAAGSMAGSIVGALLSRDQALRKGLVARGFVLGSLLGLAHGCLAPYLEYDRVQRRARTLQLLQPEDTEQVLETARQLGVEDLDRPWAWELSKRYPWLPVYFTDPGEKSWVHSSTNPSRHLYAVDEATVPWLPNEGPDRPSHIPPMFTEPELRLLESRLGPDWYDRLQPPEFPDYLIRELMDPAEVAREAERLLQPGTLPAELVLAQQPPKAGSEDKLKEDGFVDAAAATAADEQRWQRARQRAARSIDLARLGREMFTENGDLREGTRQPQEVSATIRMEAAVGREEIESRWRALGRLVSVPDLPRMSGHGIWS